MNLFERWKLSDHNNSHWALFSSVERKLANKANVTHSLNYMSAIFHNMNLNMLHLYMNFQYLYELHLLFERRTLRDHNNPHWALCAQANKANVTDSLNQMSAIFHNMNLNMQHLYMNLLCKKILYAQWTVSDHNNSHWALFFSVERMLANQANLKASLNFMSAIFHNMNLNMLHLYMNL